MCQTLVSRFATFSSLYPVEGGVRARVARSWANQPARDAKDPRHNTRNNVRMNSAHPSEGRPTAYLLHEQRALRLQRRHGRGDGVAFLLPRHGCVRRLLLRLFRHRLPTSKWTCQSLCAGIIWWWAPVCCGTSVHRVCLLLELCSCWISSWGSQCITFQSARSSSATDSFRRSSSSSDSAMFSVCADCTACASAAASTASCARPMSDFPLLI
jgi:hypothetical protein